VESRLNAKVHDVQLTAVRRDGHRELKLAVAASFAAEGVAPGEVGAEHDDAVVAGVAHVQRARHHAHAYWTAELPLAVATAVCHACRIARYRRSPLVCRAWGFRPPSARADQEDYDDVLLSQDLQASLLDTVGLLGIGLGAICKSWAALRRAVAIPPEKRTWDVRNLASPPCCSPRAYAMRAQPQRRAVARVAPRDVNTLGVVHVRVDLEAGRRARAWSRATVEQELPVRAAHARGHAGHVRARRVDELPLGADVRGAEL
jgi:hypothetical protein